MFPLLKEFVLSVTLVLVCIAYCVGNVIVTPDDCSPPPPNRKSNIPRAIPTKGTALNFVADDSAFFIVVKLSKVFAPLSIAPSVPLNIVWLAPPFMIVVFVLVAVILPEVTNVPLIVPVVRKAK